MDVAFLIFTVVIFFLQVVEIALDQTGLPNERKLAIVDKNRDLYLTNVRKV